MHGNYPLFAHVKDMKHCTLTSAYFILQDTKTVELCDGYAMTTCAWYFATSCRKVTGHWKRGSIDTGNEVKVRARNIRLQSKLQGLCARMLFLIMRLPEISCSGPRGWCIPMRLFLTAACRRLLFSRKG